MGQAEGSDKPGGAGAMEPADRLEQALNRIAFALDRRREAAPAAAPYAPAPQAPDPHAIDLHALAANIDILIARVRDAIGPDADHDDEDR
ncbi:hypothetical protein HLH33_01645 [Gluconacetobacter diazotrophicus]|uniref:Uncharacterized protein n=2 Tax=Gluconacetobacter diazotrophicus TaxID=33996 RepID=A9H7W7_GLUDA|nr:hypothetical protein [Gluconacetobacter diazotrophicus]TWB09820.1 hypothetical protein FBZ86_103102 [Gluconacetobacter diazotrophicus]CAP54457.1 hypothetical protein GDI0514 [Gluconacetobacter diazotrophicus PA1 5]